MCLAVAAGANYASTYRRSRRRKVPPLCADLPLLPAWPDEIVLVLRPGAEMDREPFTPDDRFETCRTPSDVACEVPCQLRLGRLPSLELDYTPRALFIENTITTLTALDDVAGLQQDFSAAVAAIVCNPEVGGRSVAAHSC